MEAANDGNVDTVAFPTATNRLQAETTGRIQPVSAPSIVKTATQTPIAVAPVVTTGNHSAENTVKSNESSAPVVTQTAAVAATNSGTQTPVASTADNKATKADNNEKSVVKADTVAKKQASAKKSESSQKVNQSSMSIVALAATVLLGTLGITYSSKKRHN